MFLNCVLILKINLRYRRSIKQMCLLLSALENSAELLWCCIKFNKLHLHTAISNRESNVAFMGS